MVYEVRFGFTARDTGMLAICIAFVAIALVLPAEAMPAWIRLMCVVFFGGGAIVMFATMLSRRVALRVDPKGITLGGSPLFRYRATTIFAPWSEINAIILFRQTVSHGAKVSYIGIRRHDGLPPSTGAGGGELSRRTTRFLIPHIAPEVVAMSRGITGWRLDRDRLADSVRHYSPHIDLIDRN